MTIKFNTIPENILEDNNIVKFNSISEIFDFLYDDDWTKEEIIEQLTDEMKKQLVLKNDNVRNEGENYYYGTDIYDFEEDLINGEIEDYKLDLNNILNDNEKEILSVMNDKKILEELKITPEDIKKCVVMATNELKELEDIIEKSNQENESFENLYKRLGGHNLWNEEKYPSHNRFDLNYKSLLVTIQQNLDKDNQQLNLSLQKSDVYIYPDNICNDAGDYLLVLDFEEIIDFENINKYINKPKEEIDNEKIENGKKDVQELLKNIFNSYEGIKKLNIDRIDYKRSIYNHQELLNSKISNSDYSDLLGCMLDIQDDFMEVKEYMDNALNEINIFKEKYINEPDIMQEEECEENY